MDFLSRTRILIGDEALLKLKNSTVAIFGIGGVGSFAAEALGRCGVGNLVLIDFDRINISNINRQIHSTGKTIGRYKVDVMKERLEEINPWIEVQTYKETYNEDTKNLLLKNNYDYVIDAIDTVTSKINLIVSCTDMKIPIVSSMGAGNKLDPSRLKIGDIYETKMCPLAKVIRYELKKQGVQALKVVYSTEKPLNINENNHITEISSKTDNVSAKVRLRPPVGSISFVPSVAGLMLASIAVRDMIGVPVDTNH